MKSVYILLLIIVIATSKRAIHNQGASCAAPCQQFRGQCGQDQQCRSVWNGCIDKGQGSVPAIQSCIRSSGNQIAQNYESCITKNCPQSRRFTLY